MDLPERDEAKSWEGSTVVDRDGEVLGRCTGVFADTDTGVTEWLAVDVEGHRPSFVPALGATESAGTVRVPFVRGTVLAAPRVGDEEQLSKSDEVLLYRHYDVAHTSTASGSVLPDGPGALGSEETSTAVAPTPITRPSSGSPLPSSTESLGMPPTGGSEPVGGTSSVEDLAPRHSSPVDLEPTQAMATGTATPEPPTTGMTTGTATAPTPAVEPSIEPVAVVTAAAEPETVAPPVVVSSASESRPVPVPTPAATGSSPAVGPLAVVAGVVTAAALALKAWERRAERRRAPQARAARLTRTVKTGSALAARSASKQLADASTAASRTSRQATRTTKALASSGADSASRTGRTATRRTRELAAAGSDSASRASRRASRSTKALAASSTGSVSKTRKRASKRASRGTRTLARTTSRSKRDLTSTVSVVPKTVAEKGRTVAKKGRRARRSMVGNLWDLVILSGTGAGYVLGARAGRERYEQINHQASEFVASPQVQALTRAAADPERRQQVIAPVKRSTSALTGRLQGPRP